MPRKFPHAPVVEDQRKNRKKTVEASLPAEHQCILLDNISTLRGACSTILWKANLLYSTYSLDDLFQEGWASMITAKKYPQPVKEELLRWAYQVFKNQCLSELRTRKSQVEAMSTFVEEEAAKALSDVRKPQYELLLLTLPILPVGQQEVVQGYLDKKSGKELALELGISITAVKCRYSSACIRLRKVLCNKIV